MPLSLAATRSNLGTMISEQLSNAIRRGAVTFEEVRAEFPEISAEERKVLAFEARTEALRTGVLGLGGRLREEVTNEKRNQLAWLNSIARDATMSRTAREIRSHQGRDAESVYFLREVTRTIRALAVNEALREALEAERTRRQKELEPIQRLAHEMREHLDAARKLEELKAAAERGPLEKTPAELLAQGQLDRGADAFDHLPGPINNELLRERQQARGIGRAGVSPAMVRQKSPSVTAAKPAIPSKSNWLEKLQAKAYGGKDGE